MLDLLKHATDGGIIRSLYNLVHLAQPQGADGTLLPYRVPNWTTGQRNPQTLSGHYDSFLRQ
jgi:hypothetical protein